MGKVCVCFCDYLYMLKSREAGLLWHKEHKCTHLYVICLCCHFCPVRAYRRFLTLNLDAPPIWSGTPHLGFFIHLKRCDEDTHQTLNRYLVIGVSSMYFLQKDVRHDETSVYEQTLQTQTKLAKHQTTRCIYTGTHITHTKCLTLLCYRYINQEKRKERNRHTVSLSHFT